MPAQQTRHRYVTVSLAVSRDSDFITDLFRRRPTSSHVTPPPFANYPIALLGNNQLFKDFTKVDWPLRL